jgi:hypothetical protein
MVKKMNEAILKQKLICEGMAAGFVLTGIKYYNSSNDSMVEYFCPADKKFITRPWDTWRRCFQHNNTKFRPACCYERMTGKKFIDLSSKNIISDKSNFSDVPGAMPSEQAGFTQGEKDSIVGKLSNPNRKKVAKVPIEKVPVPTGDKERRAFIKEHAARLNAEILNIEGLKTKSKIFMRCKICGVENKGTMLKNMGTTQRLRCCENKNRQVGMSDTFVQKLNARGHQIVGPEPESRTGPVKIYCINHDEVFTTTRDQYERGVTGLPCCGNIKQVEARKAHVSTAAPPRKGQTQWRNQVQQNEGFGCFVSGETSRVEVHHLFSVVGYPKLANNPRNGIVLDRSLHRKFHAWHGQNDSCNVENLCDFLSFISNPKNTEGKVFFDAIRGLKFANLEHKLEELKARSKVLTKLLNK